MNYTYTDFTEDNYRKLLLTAKENYFFATYNDSITTKKHVIWRHDIDFSPHRAYRLAQIEKDVGVKSTYCILLHCEFYNALERTCTEIFKKIIDLGHDIGLHFDPSFYNLKYGENNTLDNFLHFERGILENVLHTQIHMFSFHNPEVGDWLNFTDETAGGLINAYSSKFRQKYGYCSDSNGYWRFRRLGDVLTAHKEGKLHVLTHPEWWVPEEMSPRDRISRCIDGRSSFQHSFYDDLLESLSRKNIR